MNNPDLEQYDIIEATSKPLRVDDLRDGMGFFIGFRCHWRAIYRITEHERGAYNGQWALEPIIEGVAPSKIIFLWAPFCDLSDISKHVKFKDQ